VLVEAAIVWTIPAPPFTRYSTDIDYDYLLQSFGITVNLIMIDNLRTREAILQIAVARVCAQVVGILTAIVISCLVFPQSGYTKARELTATAIQRASKLLTRLSSLYYGELTSEENLRIMLRRTMSNSSCSELIRESMKHRRASSMEFRQSSDMFRSSSVPSFEEHGQSRQSPSSAQNEQVLARMSSRGMPRSKAVPGTGRSDLPMRRRGSHHTNPNPGSRLGPGSGMLLRNVLGRGSSPSLGLSRGSAASDSAGSLRDSEHNPMPVPCAAGADAVADAPPIQEEDSQRSSVRIVIDRPSPTFHGHTESVGSEASSRYLLSDGMLEARVELADSCGKFRPDGASGAQDAEYLAEVPYVEVDCGLEVPVMVTSEALAHFQEWGWKSGDGLAHSDMGEPPRLEESEGRKRGTGPPNPGELQKEVEACVQMMDAGYAQLSLANKYGQKWSKRIPALGNDPSILATMRKAEELLATLRSVCDIIAADQSLLFGPYALKHSAALCPTGMAAFRAAPATLRGAYNFAKYGHRRWESLSQALGILAFRVRRPHPLQLLSWSHRDTQAAPPVAWAELRENILMERGQQLEAYSDAWLNLAYRYSHSEHQQSCADIPGYSAQDVLRLHVVMFHISELQHMLVEALDDAGSK